MKKSEKRLLAVFLGLILTGALMLGATSYLKNRRALLTERDRLETEWIKLEVLLDEKKVWQTRTAWLDANQPVFRTVEEIDQEIFQTASTDAVEGVAFSGQTLLPSLETPYFTQAGVFMMATGELPAVFQWLHGLTSPKQFRALRNVQMASNKENSGLVDVRFELLRWYRPRQ